MAVAMRHGGPDDDGIYVDESRSLALGHRRLSIIDIGAGGHQPMADADGQLRVIFNGEIYNYRELRAELRGAGWHFRTASDTEVILKAYQQWGIDCFKRFIGMFALAIDDVRKSRVVLARDHAGIKPLYYYLAGDQLYFASEIRAFHVVTKRFEAQASWKIPFLAFGHLPEPVTTLGGVRPLERGQCLVVDMPAMTCTATSFWDPEFTAEIRDAAEVRQRVRQKLEDAVSRHLISDAPIGLFLSGGIDSSVLALLSRPMVGERLTTLSITFPETKFSERPYQQLIARSIGSRHLEFEVARSEFGERMPDALRAMDQPTIDGLNSYFISLFARQGGLKAVLAGHGADELFGGYPTFRYGRYYRFGVRLPVAFWRAIGRMPNDRWAKVGYIAMAGPVGEYLAYRGLFTVNAIAALLDASVDEVRSRLAELQVPDFVAGFDDGNRVSWLETNLYLRNQLLKDADFMSMWHGLEIRVPFLDRELMELVYRIDSRLKFGGRVSKQCLIDAMTPELPEAIWDRPKQGFTFPFDEWMRDSPVTAPDTAQERALFQQFRAGRLSWSRYWCALLANRFQPFPVAKAS